MSDALTDAARQTRRAKEILRDRLSGLHLPPVLYIAGPFTHEDLIHGIPENILAASKVALECARRGFAVHCPHKNFSGFQHVRDVPYEYWCAADLAILERCDAVLFLEGWANSEGASREMQFAEEKGIPIFFARNGIPDPHRIYHRNDLFYRERMNALQKYQKELPEPYRTVICNILANGTRGP